MKLDLKWLFVDLTDEQIKGVVTMAWRGLLIIHIAWACGWFSYIGIPGFATASETQDMKTQIASLRVEALEGKLFDTRLKQCAIEVTGTPLERQYYRERMSKLKRDFKDLTGEQYEEAPCE